MIDLIAAVNLALVWKCYDAAIVTFVLVQLLFGQLNVSAPPIQQVPETPTAIFVGASLFYLAIFGL